MNDVIDLDLLSEDDVAQICDSWGVILGPTWSDPDISDQDKHLETVLEGFGLCTADNLARIRAAAKSRVYRFLRRYSLMQYLLLEMTNGWIVFNEETYKSSYCRALFQIPWDKPITILDAGNLSREITSLKEALGEPTADTLRRDLRESTIDFFGLHIPIRDMDRLEKCISWLGVSWGLRCRFETNGVLKFILGETECRDHGAIRVVIFLSEWVRSPLEPLSASGFSNTSQSRIFARRCSFKVIFRNKWGEFLNESESFRYMENYHPFNTIRNECKQRALSALGITSAVGAWDSTELIVGLIEKSTVWNQIGVILRHNDPSCVSAGAPAWYLVGGDDGPLSALTTILNDWWPSQEGSITTIPGLIDLSERAPSHAESFFWMYLSDYWFMDSENETLLELLSCVAHGLMLTIARRGLPPDYSALPGIQRSICELLQGLVSDYIRDLDQLVENHRYMFGTRELDYKGIQGEFKIRWRKTFSRTADLPADLSSYPGYACAFWKWMEDTCPADYAVIREAIVQLNQRAYTALLEFVNNRAPTSVPTSSIKGYVLQRHRDLGVLIDREMPDYRSIVRRVVTQHSLDSSDETAVIKRFEALLFDGERIEASLQEDGVADPFITVLQQLMIESGKGNLSSETLLGEYFDTIDSPRDAEAYLKEELESIRDLVEKRTLLRVPRLVINSTFDTTAIVRQLVRSITLRNGTRLVDHIDEITVEAVPICAAVIAQTGLRFGFVDWNTWHAIWRVNQMIRPDEFADLWTVDRDFLLVLMDDRVHP